MSSSINMSLDQAIQSRRDTGRGDFKSKSSPFKSRKIFKKRFNSDKPFFRKFRREERSFGLKKRFGDRKFNSRFIRRTKPSRFAKKIASPRKYSGDSNKSEEKTKLKITNLDWNVVNEDLMQLFSKLGTVVRNKVIYDSLGRSKGKAFVEFEKAENAAEAIKEYNGVDLDGRTITVEYDEEEIRPRKEFSGVLRKKIYKRSYDRGFDRDREFRRRDGFRRRDDFFRKSEGRFRREREGERRGFGGFRRGGFRKFDNYRSNRYGIA